MKENVFLGLGTNLGDRLKNINDALEKIKKRKEIKFICSSSIYETEPWGIKQQNYFLNLVIKLETDFYPQELFEFAKKCEKEIGRKKRVKWQEREIDIDILFYGDLIINDTELTIPHKEIVNRKFVLIPLNEIAGDFIHPVLKKKIKLLLQNTKDTSDVKIFNEFGK